MAKKRDWILRSLIAFTALALMVALLLSLFLLVDRAFAPAGGQPALLRNFDLAGSPATTWAASNLPGLAPEPLRYGLTGYYLVVSLLCITLVLMLTIRWRATSNRALWHIAGCPACQNDSLRRIRRRFRDRVAALSGVRMGRYRCRKCFWQGRRIRVRPAHRSDRTAAPPAWDAGKVVLVERLNSQGEAQEPAALESARVAGPYQVRLYERPHVGAPVVTLLQPGESVALLEVVQGTDSHVWQLVRAGDSEGWVRTMHLQYTQRQFE